MEVRWASVNCPAAPVPSHPQGVPLRRRERPAEFAQGWAGPVAQEISGVQAHRLPVWMERALPLRDVAREALRAARESHLGQQGAQRKRESWELTALRQILPPQELSKLPQQVPPQVSPSSEALVQKPEKQEMPPAAWAQPQGAQCREGQFPMLAFHAEAEARVQSASPTQKEPRQGGRVLPWRRRRPSRRLRRLWRGRGSACARVRRARYRPNSNGSSFR